MIAEQRARIVLLVEQHGDPLPLIDRIPRSASEVYYAWTGVSPDKPLSRRERNSRRALARHLQYLAAKGLIRRGVITDDNRTWVAFWRAVDADGAGGDQPEGAGDSAPDRRPDGRGVEQ